MPSCEQLQCPGCVAGTHAAPVQVQWQTNSSGLQWSSGTDLTAVGVPATPAASFRPHSSQLFSHGGEPGPGHKVWISIARSSLCWQQTFPCYTCARPYTSSSLPYSPAARVTTRRLYLYSHVSASRDCIPLCPHHSSLSPDHHSPARLSLSLALLPSSPSAPPSFYVICFLSFTRPSLFSSPMTCHLFLRLRLFPRSCVALSCFPSRLARPPFIFSLFLTSQ